MWHLGAPPTLTYLRNCHWFVPDEPTCCAFDGTKARHMDSVSVHAVIMILDSWHLKLWNFQLLQCSCFGLPSVDNWHKHLFLSFKEASFQLVIGSCGRLEGSGCRRCWKRVWMLHFFFKRKSDLWDLWVLLLSLQLWFRLDWVSLKHKAASFVFLSLKVENSGLLILEKATADPLIIVSPASNTACLQSWSLNCIKFSKTNSNCSWIQLCVKFIRE